MDFYLITIPSETEVKKKTMLHITIKKQKDSFIKI